MRPSLLALALGAAAAPVATGGEDAPARVVRASEHYAVHLHFEDAAAAETAREVLALAEEAWERAVALVEPAREPELVRPLAVHLYPTKESWAAVEARLTGGFFRDHESFAHWGTRTAHVALAPPLPALARARFGLTSQTREVVAHEAAHLAVYSLLGAYQWHPTWLAEGLAMAVELEVARARGLVDDPAEHPRLATNQLRARRLLESGRLPRVEAILTERLDALSTDERYALWHELTALLAEDRDAFRALLRFVAAQPAGPALRVEVGRFVRERWGSERLERTLAERLEALRPGWDEVARSLGPERDEGERLQAAFPDLDALAWRTGPAGPPPYAIAGRWLPLAPDARMDVLAGRAPASPADPARTGRLAVGLGARAVELHRFQPGRGWERLAAAELEPARPAEERDGRAFRVRVEEDAVLVEVDGLERLRVALHGRELAGEWGLGVRRGTAGLWRGVRLAR